MAASKFVSFIAYSLIFQKNIQFLLSFTCSQEALAQVVKLVRI